MHASLSLAVTIAALTLCTSRVAAESAPDAPPTAAVVTGKVVQALDAGPYTYVEIDVGTKKVWAAAPRTQLAVGATVTTGPGGMIMKNFTSKTLERTFDEIYFVGSLKPPGAAAAAPAALPTPLAAHRANGSSTKSIGDLVGIEAAEGGQTVAELYANKGELAGKSVTVRGRVVKFTAAVMGKNWIHIQDSSSETSDLTVTTAAVAKIGDTVVASGVLGVDRDFGAGYRYDIIIEDATVSVE